jgi:hypothetical protein
MQSNFSRETECPKKKKKNGKEEGQTKKARQSLGFCTLQGRVVLCALLTLVLVITVLLHRYHRVIDHQHKTFQPQPWGL